MQKQSEINKAKQNLAITFVILSFAAFLTLSSGSVLGQTIKIITPTPTPKIAEPIQVPDDEPPPPKPLPTPEINPAPPDTLAGKRVKRIQFRNLTLDLPSIMAQSAVYSGNRPNYIKNRQDFEIRSDGNAMWIDDTSYYEILNQRKELLLKIEVVTSLYSNDFARTAIEGKPAGAAAEHLLELDYQAESKVAEDPESKIGTVKYLKLSELRPGQGIGMGSNSVEPEFNVKGVYVLKEYEADKNGFYLTWHTYRSIDGKARKLKIIISGKKDELSVAEKILASAQFEKSSRMISASDSFKAEIINKFGIGGFDLPSNMIAVPVTGKNTKNGEVEWMTYDYLWKTPASKTSAGASSLEASISTKIYNFDFKKVVTDIPLEKRTPEFLLLMNHIGNSNVNKQNADQPIKEAKMIKLKGLDGSYVLFRNFSDNGFVAVWETFRLLGGKAQTITLTVKGDVSEISKAEQIIRSFKVSDK